MKFVNATSGLNYRESPKGKILGKLNHNQEVAIVKRTRIISEIHDEGMLIKGEWVGILKNQDTVFVFDTFLSNSKNEKYVQEHTNIWSKFPLRAMPFIDSTNFDNFKKKNRLTKEEILKLQLHEIYPDLLNKDPFIAYPSYGLDLNLDGYYDYKVIVFTVFKGDHEVESVLVIYEDEKLMKSYNDNSKKPSFNSLIISYDEIAEGWSRITSEIRNNCITTIDALYTEPPRIDTTLHHINRLGYINKVNIDFKNNIRPNQKLKLHTVYTDTIQFIKYNDDYDYFFIEAKKNNKDVGLIYTWDITKKYDFKKHDLIKVQWKIDSIHIAGDGETLSFSEYAINAEKIQ